MSRIRGRADHLVLGDYNAVCYVCGRKWKASEMIRHWQGYWVCPPDWEARHPQDFVRGEADLQIPPWTQPSPEPVFAAFCTPAGLSAIAGVGIAGCIIAGYISPAYLEFISDPIGGVIP